MISKTQLEEEFAKMKTEKNPKVTSDIQAVVILSGESGDPAYPTKLHDAEERTQLGIKIFKKIQKLNGNPTLILNGTNSQNESMAKLAKQENIKKIQFIKNLDFPNASTLTQFQGLANLPFKKIAIVTHGYHGPRIKRYVEKFLPNECNYALFFLGRNKITKIQIKEEIEKILKYSQKGDI